MAIINQNSKILFCALIAMILILAGFYVYFANLAIISIAKKNQGLESLKILNIQYQELENKYYDALGEIDIDYARSLGFVEQNKSAFAVRQTTVARR